MRTLVISDIHGCYHELVQLLEVVRYTPSEDRLILLGDYVDRGPHSKQVIEKIMALAENEHVIVLRGNHDQRFLSLAQSRDDELLHLFFKYGGQATLTSYCADQQFKSVDDMMDYIYTNYKEHFTFLNETKFYFEDERFIYVHAGLHPEYPNWKEQPARYFLSIREQFLQNDTCVDKVVVFGHTVTNTLQNCSGIWFTDDKIGIDGGCTFHHQLNCLEISPNGELKEHSVVHPKGV